MKILSIICHVPSSLFSYFLFVFVLFAPILGVFINHNNNNNNTLELVHREFVTLGTIGRLSAAEEVSCRCVVGALRLLCQLKADLKPRTPNWRYGVSILYSSSLTAAGGRSWASEV